jgi:hypothetical protein
MKDALVVQRFECFVHFIFAHLAVVCQFGFFDVNIIAEPAGKRNMLSLKVV